MRVLRSPEGIALVAVPDQEEAPILVQVQFLAEDKVQEEEEAQEEGVVQVQTLLETEFRFLAVEVVAASLGSDSSQKTIYVQAQASEKLSSPHLGNQADKPKP